MVSPYLNRPVRSLERVLAARAETLGPPLAEPPSQGLETAPERTPAVARQPVVPESLPSPRRAA